jgi:hypothetical protein
VAADRLVGDDEDPPFVLGASPLDADFLGRLAPAAPDQPDGDGGEHEEDDEPQPGRDKRRGDDQREVDDREPDELERLGLGAEWVPHWPFPLREKCLIGSPLGPSTNQRR